MYLRYVKNTVHLFKVLKKYGFVSRLVTKELSDEQLEQLAITLYNSAVPMINIRRDIDLSAFRNRSTCY